MQSSTTVHSCHNKPWFVVMSELAPAKNCTVINHCHIYSMKYIIYTFIHKFIQSSQDGQVTDVNTKQQAHLTRNCLTTRQLSQESENGFVKASSYQHEMEKQECEQPANMYYVSYNTSKCLKFSQKITPLQTFPIWQPLSFYSIHLCIFSKNI